MGEIKEKITKLQDEIIRMEAKIAVLRTKCKHESFEVKMFQWRIGSFHPKRICKECGEILEGITKEEEALCLEDWNKNFYSDSGIIEED